MDESTKALVATHLTEIVIKVLGNEFERGLTAKENYIDDPNRNLSRAIDNIVALYKKVHYRVPRS